MIWVCEQISFFIFSIQNFHLDVSNIHFFVKMGAFRMIICQSFQLHWLWTTRIQSKLEETFSSFWYIGYTYWILSHNLCHKAASKTSFSNINYGIWLHWKHLASGAAGLFMADGGIDTMICPRGFMTMLSLS